MRPIEIRDVRKKQFYRIDDTYLNGYAKIAKPTATAVYNSLCRHADINQESFPSIKLLSEEHGITVKSVQRAIKKLRDMNIISYEQVKDERGKWQRNRYILLDKSVWISNTVGQNRPTDNRRTFLSKAVGQNRPTKETHTKETHIYITPTPKFSSLKDITPEVIDEIATRYKVSSGFVNLQFEKMKNWLEANGRVKKNYKATLCNFVLGDMQKQVERKSDDKYRAIDARNI